MNENKSLILPPGHVVEIEYGGMKMRLYNPKSIAFSVTISKSKKGEKK